MLIRSKLQKYLSWMSVFLILFSPFVFAKAEMNTQSVTGYWQTIDSKSKKPSSIIAIQPQHGFYIGKIVKTYDVPTEQKIFRCILCRDDRKNQPIIGLRIIQNMACNATVCRGGTILDPRNGKIYKATMRLINNGTLLKVHGYVGVPLFGKTVIWRRVSKTQAQ